MSEPTALDRMLEAIGKDIDKLKKDNEMLFTQIEEHRKWMQDVHILLLKAVGQPIPAVPPVPPWVKAREGEEQIMKDGKPAT